MKQRTSPLAAGVLAVLLSLSLALPAAAAEPKTCSPWAEGYLSFAIDYQYMPEILLDQDYTQDISRLEFAHLAYQLMGKMNAWVAYYADEAAAQAQGEAALQAFQQAHPTGYDPIYPTAPDGASPFRDTSDPAVLALAQEGILLGKENQRFDPAASLTREEAATILDRLAGCYPLPHFTGDLPFADLDQVSDWAKKGVAAAYRLGLMTGTSPTTFSPQGTYTREQAVATIVRLWDSLPYLNNKTELADGLYFRFSQLWKWIEDAQGSVVMEFPTCTETYHYRPDYGYTTFGSFLRDGTLYAVCNGRASTQEPWSMTVFNVATQEVCLSIPDPEGVFLEASADGTSLITWGIESADPDTDPWGRTYYVVYDSSGSKVLRTYAWSDLYAAGYVDRAAQNALGPRPAVQ